MKIAIVSQKGGVGKTTLSVHLAVTAGKLTGIVDMDPQESVVRWFERRAEVVNTEELFPSVSIASDINLKEQLEIAEKNNFKTLIIDTPPHSNRRARLAVENADFVLIPCKPSILDLDAIKSTLDIVEAIGKPFSVILSDCPSGNGFGEPARVREVRDVLEKEKVPVCPYIITHRVDFADALNDGRAVVEYKPDCKASLEINQIWEWIQEQK